MGPPKPPKRHSKPRKATLGSDFGPEVRAKDCGTQDAWPERLKGKNKARESGIRLGSPRKRGCVDSGKSHLLFIDSVLLEDIFRCG